MHGIYQYFRDIHEFDPDTAAAWTSSGVNGMQIGPEVVWPRAAASVAAEVLATSDNQARVSAIALEAWVSLAEVPGVPTSAYKTSIVMVLGA